MLAWSSGWARWHEQQTYPIMINIITTTTTTTNNNKHHNVWARLRSTPPVAHCFIITHQRVLVSYSLHTYTHTYTYTDGDQIEKRREGRGQKNVNSLHGCQWDYIRSSTDTSDHHHWAITFRAIHVLAFSTWSCTLPVWVSSAARKAYTDADTLLARH